MKRKMIGAALALLISNGMANAFTQQECEKVWSKENWALESKKCKEADPSPPAASSKNRAIIPVCASPSRSWWASRAWRSNTSWFR